MCIKKDKKKYIWLLRLRYVSKLVLWESFDWSWKSVSATIFTRYRESYVFRHKIAFFVEIDFPLFSYLRKSWSEETVYDKCVTMYGSVCFCVKEICKPMKVYWKYVCTPIRQREKKKRNNNLNTDGEDDRALWRKKKFPKFLAIQLANFIEQIFLLSLLTNNFSNLFLPNNSAVKNVLSKKKKKREKCTKIRNIYARWITRDYTSIPTGDPQLTKQLCSKARSSSADEASRRPC